MRPYCRITVAGKGYFWCSVAQTTDFGQEYEKLYLTRKGGDLKPDRTYDLFDQHYASAYRDFAQMWPNQSSILCFANTYGMLGFEEPFKQHVGSKTWHGEPWNFWIREHKALGEAVGVLDCIRSRKSAAIAKRFRSVANKGSMQGIPDDLREEALFLLANKNMVKEISVRQATVLAKSWLGLRINERLAEGLRTDFVWDKYRQDMVLHVVPKNLLQAMWLQLAIVLDTRRTNTECDHCGVRFRADSSKARFCSIRCQVAAWRLAKTS